MAFHAAIDDTMNIDQLIIDAVDEASVEIENIGDAPGHAGTKIDPGVTEYSDNAAGHVFAAMVTNTLDYRIGTGVTDRKTFTGKTGSEQLATGCTIQTGIADNGRIL